MVEPVEHSPKMHVRQRLMESVCRGSDIGGGACPATDGGAVNAAVRHWLRGYPWSWPSSSARSLAWAGRAGRRWMLDEPHEKRSDNPCAVDGESRQ